MEACSVCVLRFSKSMHELNETSLIETFLKLLIKHVKKNFSFSLVILIFPRKTILGFWSAVSSEISKYSSSWRKTLEYFIQREADSFQTLWFWCECYDGRVNPKNGDERHLFLSCCESNDKFMFQKLIFIF